MTRLSDQIDNENNFGLGHWSETNTQYSDTHHMMHAPLTTPEPLNIAATAPMDTSGVTGIQGRKPISSGLPADWNKFREPARVQRRKQKMPRVLGGLTLV